MDSQTAVDVLSTLKSSLENQLAAVNTALSLLTDPKNPQLLALATANETIATLTAQLAGPPTQ